jgi:hypothetical protein
MTTIMTRSALRAWGQSPPADLAFVVSEGHGHRRVVTWADVMQQRRERQRWILARKRAGREPHAYKLWVAFYDTTFFGGWHAFLETYTGQLVWIDKNRRFLRPTLMAVYPLVIPFGDPSRPSWPVWEQWKVAFAQQYARRRHARKPLGVTYVWWDGADDLRHATERLSTAQKEAR